MEQNFKHIKDAMHIETCNFLTDFLRQCSENNIGMDDGQCPKSSSVSSHQHDILDKVLEEFTPFMEKEVGKKLFPTYAYARYYLNGEVLLCHTDRPACEYSATITLGFDKNVWPIFIANPGKETDQGIIGEFDEIFRVKDVSKIEMEVGDAVVYKGGVAPHWRDAFEGQWQAQIFLHYVDQNGKYSEEKFDRRKKLSHHKIDDDKNDNELLYWYVPNAIADIACDQMIEKFESSESHKAFVGGTTSGENGLVDLSIRDVNKIQITNEIGIGATLTGIGFNINKRSWNFDVTHSNQSEYLKYDVNGHYVCHPDTYLVPSEKECRKITVLAFLNDDFEGGKFYLQNGHSKTYPEQKKGTVIAFPSFINHGVEPVKSGIRRSIVTWIVGPWFR